AEWMAILANYCRAAGHADADRVLEESRQVVRELYGEQHRQSAALLWHDALEHRRRGEYDKAEAAYARAAETFRTVLGPDHETSRKALDLLASLQRKRAATAEKEGDRESAIRYYASDGRTWAARHRPDHWRVRETVVLADECRFLLKVTRPDMKKIDEAMTAVERAAKMADDNRAREAIPIARTAYETLASTAGPRRR